MSSTTFSASNINLQCQVKLHLNVNLQCQVQSKCQRSILEIILLLKERNLKTLFVEQRSQRRQLYRGGYISMCLATLGEPTQNAKCQIETRQSIQLTPGYTF